MAQRREQRDRRDRRNTAGYRSSRWLGGHLAALLLRLLGATWRVRIDGPDPFRPGDTKVLAAWHRSLLIAAYGWRGRNLVIPVSRSRDGDWIDSVLRRLGFAASARGSSSRGATALLRELIRRARRGETIGMLPDGPRGPAGVAKPGIVALARVTGAEVVPVGIAAAPVWRFGSWDRAELPRPFARVQCVYGEPLRVPRDASPEQLEAERVRFEEAMNRLDAVAAERLGSKS
jgi:lysophospholipid acyltransferase (LPLAT)-like uncharacterized protein